MFMKRVHKHINRTILNLSNKKLYYPIFAHLFIYFDQTIKKFDDIPHK
jgi:hypothetical protein